MFPYRWQQAKALPGVNRLMKHLRKHGVPFALASNSITKNIDVKISHHEGRDVLYHFLTILAEIIHSLHHDSFMIIM